MCTVGIVIKCPSMENLWVTAGTRIWANAPGSPGSGSSAITRGSLVGAAREDGGHRGPFNRADGACGAWKNASRHKRQCCARKLRAARAAENTSENPFDGKSLGTLFDGKSLSGGNRDDVAFVDLIVCPDWQGAGADASSLHRRGQCHDGGILLSREPFCEANHFHWLLPFSPPRPDTAFQVNEEFDVLAEDNQLPIVADRSLQTKLQLRSQAIEHYHHAANRRLRADARRWQQWGRHKLRTTIAVILIAVIQMKPAVA